MMAKKLADLGRAAFRSLTRTPATPSFCAAKVEKGRGILVAERASRMPSGRAYQAYDPLASALVIEGEMLEVEDAAMTSLTLGIEGKVLAATLLTFVFFEVKNSIGLNRIQKNIEELELLME